MILVDSSVWIDYLRGVRNQQTEQLDDWLGQPEVLIGVADLVVFEVLRGFTSEKERQVAKRLLLTLEVVEIGGWDAAMEATEHYVQLRARGYTIASPIDVLLTSYCITHDHLLLHRDSDFDVMKTLRGLKAWSY
jgi:predicted nucleic acid-binding protein